MLLVVALLTAAAAAQEPAKPAPPGGKLGDMLLDRPAVPVTPPQDAPAPPDTGDKPICGSAEVNRRCRIEYRSDTGWFLLTFLPRQAGEEVHPRWVLPCEFLPAIEKALAEDPQTNFRVSGETTVHHDRVFILLRNVMVERLGPDQDDDGEAGEQDDSADAAAGEDAADEPAAPALTPPGAPSTQLAPPATAAQDDSQDDILAAMLADRPDKPLAGVAQPVPVKRAASVAPAQRAQLSEDRGQMRIDRVIVMAKDASGEWWEARFESDNTLQDQPVRLLPCKLLERAEELTARHPYQAVRLRVSGEMLDHAGHRYMLLRKVLLEKNLGQF